MHGLLARKFHEKISGMLGAMGIPHDGSLWPREWTTVFFKTYNTNKKIKLPSPKLNGATLESAFRARESFRVFNTNAFLKLAELSTILYFGAGIKNPPSDASTHWNLTKRFYPSGGGRYPVEIYCALARVEGIAPGIYHYRLKDHSLEFVGDEEKLREFIGGLTYPWSRNASAFVLMTAVWERTMSKYKDLGYKFVLLETGHLAQNMLLAATSLNIGSCSLAGFYAAHLEWLLELPKLEESPVHLIALGR